MMFLYFYLCRSKTVPAVYLIGELLPAFPSESFLQFFFFHGMFHYNDREPFQVLFPFPRLLFRPPPGRIGRILPAVIRVFRGNSLRLIKKDDLAIHFHKRDLAIRSVSFG